MIQIRILYNNIEIKIFGHKLEKKVVIIPGSRPFPTPYPHLSPPLSGFIFGFGSIFWEHFCCVGVFLTLGVITLQTLLSCKPGYPGN